ncbi:polb [Symbiodinium pilosum]|uniref:DNA-directed DNA polymerase n=1 Tax=Symbiodinium pilosum TaxID=2952 RepID=A0A812V2R3_SYMPI|nr:polb [Symbiodinium pilosum]
MVGIARQVTDYMVERRLNLKDDLDQQDGDCVVKYRASASMESQCQVQLKRRQKEHRKAIEHAAVQAVHGNLTATCLCGSAPARRWIASTTWQRRRSWCSLLPDLSASPSMKHQVESDQGSGSEIASEGGIKDAKAAITQFKKSPAASGAGLADMVSNLRSETSCQSAREKTPSNPPTSAQPRKVSFSAELPATPSEDAMSMSEAESQFLVEEDGIWKACDAQETHALRLAGAGLKQQVDCKVEGRSCELDLGRKVERDKVTGFCRKLRVLPQDGVEAAAAAAAGGQPDITFMPGPPAREASPSRAKRTLSGYFARTSEPTSQAKSARLEQPLEPPHQPPQQVRHPDQVHYGSAASSRVDMRVPERQDAVDSKTGPCQPGPFTSVHEILANGDIPFPRVRVVDDRGLVGDFNLGEALALAKQRRTDLVVLSGAVDPPLCRLVNLHVYIDELERQAASKEQQQREQRLREFSFDPAMRVKGMRFSSVIDEHDFERKLNQVRKFLEKGHRVEARILQSRGKPEDVLDLALRIIAEVRDLAKPEYFEESIRELQVAIHSPKSLKRTGRAPPDELRMRLWPCTPAQAAAFQLPAHIIGPRRRRGPAIVGVDDGPQDDDAWKLNRRLWKRLRKIGTRRDRHDFAATVFGESSNQLASCKANDNVLQCIQSGNERIASIFEEMSVVQKLRRAYAKAAQALRVHGEPIASGAQAKGIAGIGSGMAGRIDVILATGELSELEELKRDSDVIALRELRSVHGIGAVRAAELVERGIRSLAHLREAVAKNQVHLDAAQVVGLRHCEEFMKRIPYAEMLEHHQKLEALRLKNNPSLLLTVCGSYRRGRPDCGDIDVLISHPDYTTAKRDANAGGKLLHGFVESLKTSGYVTADLAFGNTKFMGVCRLSGEDRLHRRLDIRCLPKDQYHFGMLYFTGSAALGVKMRLKAIEMGLTLSEYGLENRRTGEKVAANSEKDIFRTLA